MANIEKAMKEDMARHNKLLRKQGLSEPSGDSTELLNVDDQFHLEMGMEHIASRLYEATKRIELLEDAINQHNEECARLCDNKKRCGYENYKHDCGRCTKDWSIDI